MKWVKQLKEHDEWMEFSLIFQLQCKTLIIQQCDLIFARQVFYFRDLSFLVLWSIGKDFYFCISMLLRIYAKNKKNIANKSVFQYKITLRPLTSYLNISWTCDSSSGPTPSPVINVTVSLPPYLDDAYQVKQILELYLQSSMWPCPSRHT